MISTLSTNGHSILGGCSEVVKMLYIYLYIIKCTQYVRYDSTRMIYHHILNIQYKILKYVQIDNFCLKCRSPEPIWKNHQTIYPLAGVEH